MNEIDHINRNTEDNRLVNLRWADDYIQAINKNPYGAYCKYMYLEDVKTKKNPNPSWRIRIKNNKCKFCKRFAYDKYTYEEVKKIRDNILNEYNIEIID